MCVLIRGWRWRCLTRWGWFVTTKPSINQPHIIIIIIPAQIILNLKYNMERRRAFYCPFFLMELFCYQRSLFLHPHRTCRLRLEYLHCVQLSNRASTLQLFEVECWCMSGPSWGVGSDSTKRKKKTGKKKEKKKYIGRDQSWCWRQPNRNQQNVVISNPKKIQEYVIIGFSPAHLLSCGVGVEAKAINGPFHSSKKHMLAIMVTVLLAKGTQLNTTKRKLKQATLCRTSRPHDAALLTANSNVCIVFFPDNGVTL